jgi:acetyltransferase-like isoleucine patch superfamily enzyme
MIKYLTYIKNNGLIVFALETLSRIFGRLRGLVYWRIFTAELGTIGPNVYIRGLSAIRINSSFKCGRMLWLEALQNYRGTAYAPIVRIGSRVSLSNNVHISCVHQISIGDDVLIGSNVYISDHNHGTYGAEAYSTPEIAPANRALCSRGPVIIEDRVWIGDGVVICGGVKIGSGAVIGANSFISKDVPPNTVVAGFPARVIKQFKAGSGWVKF